MVTGAGDVTVVVCAYTLRRYPQLLDCLASIHAQTHRPERVIVVVDGCPELAAALRNRNGTETIVEHETNRGLSAARNTGVANARTSWVAFLDDDATADPTWLERLIAGAVATGAVGAGGWSEPEPDRPIPQWFAPELLWTIGCSHRGLPRRRAIRRNTFGGCAVLKTELFTLVGGYAEDLGRRGSGVQGGEEMEFCLRVAAALPEARFAHVPDAVIRHRIVASRLSRRYVLRRCYSDGRTKARVSRRAGRHALGPERAFVLSALSRGVLGTLLRGHPQRAAILAAGLASAALGYAAGRVQRRAGYLPVFALLLAVTAGAALSAPGDRTWTGGTWTGGTWTGGTWTGRTGAAADGPASYRPSAADFYVNYAQPTDERSAQAGPGPVGAERPPAGPTARPYGGKFTQGNPAAGRTLAAIERAAIQTGRNPRELTGQANRPRRARMLTILVEFNPTANDDFTKVYLPKRVLDDPLTENLDERACAPGTIQNGPRHNQIENPARRAKPDNSTMWVPDFSPEYFHQMLFAPGGITNRVRTDLTGPDGKPGIDLRGYSMRNMFLEMSKGNYDLGGRVTRWVTVPHSEAWYGADTCQRIGGVWQSGTPQDDDGHPDNRYGAAQLGIDAVAALAKADPGFPWADFDLEDVTDADGDGNLAEPDGVIDHLALVHAGEDASSGGGAEGAYAMWARSSAIVPAATIPGTKIMISNYILQPENAGVGVFAHEYGHDLGLPDLYDTGSGGSADVEYWDLMGAGSHSGPILASIPTHLGIWSKLLLGWVDPMIIKVGSGVRTVTLGQASRPPKDTRDGVRIELPPKTYQLAAPHGGARHWWTGRDQSWADVRLTRKVKVPRGANVRFWLWNNYAIESDWDFGFVEISTDGGRSWREQRVYNASGALVSTGPDYPDPNRSLYTFGRKRYGLTGSSGGYRHDQVDLTPFAGQTVLLRLRYTTDTGYEDVGWFADDFSLVADGATVWSDDVERGAGGWTATATTFTSTRGEPWTATSGTFTQPQYYLAEWRTGDGFDAGLRHGYLTNYQRAGSTKVERMPYNVPGLLLWYRDPTWGKLNHTLTTVAAPPSYGPKGGLLLVDAHFEPLRRLGVAAAKDPVPLDNLASRAQASNAAFGFQPTPAFTECYEAPKEPFSAYCTDVPRLPAVTSFDDARAWYPGLEYRPDIDQQQPLHFRDADASTVVPSRGNAGYSTRVVDSAGQPLLALYGVRIAEYGLVLGSGEPGVDKVALGVRISLLQPGPGNRWVRIAVRAANPG